MAGLEVAVDQAYAFVSSHYPKDELALMPDFLSYEYRLDASAAILRRDHLASAEDLALRHTPNRTTVLSWQPPSSGSLQQVAHFTGCRPTTLLDRLLPCEPGEGIYVMRYVGDRMSADLARRASEANRLLQLSYTLCHERRQRECIAAARAAIILLPTYAEAWNNIAAAYEDMGRWDEAIQAAQQAVNLKPDFQLARNNLAWAESQKLKQRQSPASK
jgi:tetratricopeptide (TPR) repeat protein